MPDNNTNALLEAIRGVVREEVAPLTQRLEGLENRFGNLEGRFEAMEGRFDGLETRFDTLTEKVDETQRQITSLDTKINQVEQRMMNRMQATDEKFVVHVNSVERAVFQRTDWLHANLGKQLRELRSELIKHGSLPA